jgi:formiminotetrahydrofolate cyclodeaminase
MSVWTFSAAELRERTASSEPTPGGGSVACVCATLGAGLVVMALEITLKKATGADAEALRPRLDEARRLLERLASHADRDVEVFNRYMAAMAKPKSTDDEKAARRQGMVEAAVAATEAPLAAAQDVLLMLDLAESVAKQVKPQVLSDVLAGADLLAGAVAALLRNVDINLPSIDGDRAGAFAARRREIAEAMTSVRKRVCEPPQG